MQHIVARKSEKSEQKRGKSRSLDALPQYTTQYGIAAKRCFRARCCLMALDRPGSVKLCQDMLHRRGQHGGKITVTHYHHNPFHLVVVRALALTTTHRRGLDCTSVCLW